VSYDWVCHDRVSCDRVSHMTGVCHVAGVSYDRGVSYDQVCWCGDWVCHITGCGDRVCRCGVAHSVNVFTEISSICSTCGHPHNEYSSLPAPRAARNRVPFPSDVWI